MPLRDIFVLTVIMVSLPFILKRPWIGVLVWSWIGYMNPHRLGWGFAMDFRFALIVALFTLFALLISREQKKIPWTRETVVLVLFILWMVATTVMAKHSALAWVQLDKVLKIQLMTFVTLMVITTRDRIHILVWVIAMSLAFYGIKGGVFTITTGGAHRVYGPLGTFIGGNNEMGLALVMTVPLLRYLQLQTGNVWVRRGLTAAIALCFLSILGTHSRGALVGVTAMLLFLLWKSPKRFRFLVVLAVLVPVAFMFMPEHWHERMHSIQTYEEDRSVQGRFAAWRFATQIALEDPVFGGGFHIFAGRTDAHSIYFKVLGEHGFVGLALFLLLGWWTWRAGSTAIKHAKGVPELKWASDLARMIQVSLVGYASCGAFLGLSYFDLFYHLVALMVMTKVMVLQHVAAQVAPEPTPDPGSRPRFLSAGRYG